MVSNEIKTAFLNRSGINYLSHEEVEQELTRQTEYLKEFVKNHVLGISFGSKYSGTSTHLMVVEHQLEPDSIGFIVSKTFSSRLGSYNEKLTYHPQEGLVSIEFNRMAKTAKSEVLGNLSSSFGRCGEGNNSRKIDLKESPRKSDRKRAALKLVAWVREMETRNSRQSTT